MRVMAVIGARPNLPKIAPLIRELQCDEASEYYLVHTGQHYDPKLSDIFFHELGIPTPNAHLGIGSGSQATQTAKIMLAFEPVLLEWKPDMLVVVGDVNSTLAAALVATKLSVPVAHIEAGLRSNDRTMPEEINRIITDNISELLFTPSLDANHNLAREGVTETRIHFVGNIMIDTLLYQLERARQLDVISQWDLAKKNYILVTLHRPSNVDQCDSLEAILAVLSDLQQGIPILFPMHPRTRHRIREFKLESRLADAPLLKVTEPFSYLEFLSAMDQATVVLTDSGGVQEETTALGVPCLTLRDNTERPITVTQGTNRLIGSDPRNILSNIHAVLNQEQYTIQRPELWDGQTAKRIVAVLKQYVQEERS